MDPRAVRGLQRPTRPVALRGVALLALLLVAAGGCTHRSAAAPAAVEAARADVDGEAYRLIGFTLAHALVSVSDGDPLATLSFSEHDTDRKLTRYDGPTLQASVDNARAQLAHPTGGTRWSALAFDGYAKFDGTTKVDALWVELRDARGAVQITLAQIYRPVRKGVSFAVVWPPIVRKTDGNANPLGSKELRDVLTGVLQHPMGRTLLRGLRMPAPNAPPASTPKRDPSEEIAPPGTTTI